MGTLIISLILADAVALIIRHLVRQHRKGVCAGCRGCGGDCPHGASCQEK